MAVPSCRASTQKGVVTPSSLAGPWLPCCLPRSATSWPPPRSHQSLPKAHVAKSIPVAALPSEGTSCSAGSASLLWSKHCQMQFSGAHRLQQAFYLPQMPANEKGLLLLLLSPKTEWQQRLLPIPDLTLGKLHFPTPPKEMPVTLFIHVVSYHMRQAEKGKSQC